MTAHDSSRVRIGISSCLLGEKVRFDGGHKKDEFLTSHFGRYVEWVPVCPEFEIGLGVPREYLWILSRSPQMDDATYNRLVDEARAQDFDVSRLQKTRQSGS